MVKLPNDRLKPIGLHTSKDGAERRIVMMDGVPYYQSSGQSHTPGFGKKEQGSWWPFSGIEPTAGKWTGDNFSNPENWYMKGGGFGVHPDPENKMHDIDWKVNKPNVFSTVLNNPRRQEQMAGFDWPAMTGARQVNEALAEHGWDAPIRGEYPQAQPIPPPPPPPGSLQAQGSQFQNGEPMDIAWLMLKRQTKLYNWIPDYPDMPPIQQLSAQPQKYMENYLEGEYPDEFWSFIGDNPEDTEGHGASRHRSDDDGNYLAVGVRGEAPIGDVPTRGPFRNIKDGGGVRVVGKDDMPDPDNIVVMPKNAAHMPQFDPKQKGEFRKPKPQPSKRKYVRISQ